jgi:hypothetical protein
MKKIIYTFAFVIVLMSSCSKKDDAKPDASNVTITSVKVITIPLTDGGAAWDATDGSGADVFFKIENTSTVFYTHPQYVQDVTSALLPFIQTITNGYKLPSLSQSYNIGLYDYDSLSGDDFISSVSFLPSDYKKDRPASKTFTNGLVQVEVSFSWE